MQTAERPIGYWVRHLDRLIDAAFDQAFAREGLGRREWQVMNALVSPVDAAGLAEALRPFWDGDGDATEVTRDLERRGWLDRDADGRYVLTPQGAAARDAAAARVDAIRTTVGTSLTGEEYAEAVRLLRRMSANLEAAQQRT